MPYVAAALLVQQVLAVGLQHPDAVLNARVIAGVAMSVNYSRCIALVMAGNVVVLHRAELRRGAFESASAQTQRPDKAARPVSWI